MVTKEDIATVSLWGDYVGAIAWDKDRELGSFEFDPSFLKKNINLSPYLLTHSPGIINYPSINKDTYKGLPGFLADTLPDDFGNAIISAWLARMGKPESSFSPVQRLCYTGTRGMGALEFHPALSRHADKNTHIEISELVELAGKVLHNRSAFVTTLGTSDTDKKKALSEIMSVGTSAGGQRPKAVLSINPKSGKIISGQIQAPKGYEYWILKFDGVTSGNANGVISDPQGFGAIEYAYYLMAQKCGITMMESKLLTENGRSHFMTKRFDRTETGEKIHLLSLCGMAHFDYHKAGYYSYEQLFMVMRALKLPHSQAIEQYRRMVFNVITRNQDDHTKNFAFLLKPDGTWAISPAFDVTYSYNPFGAWTQWHQMTINGKRDNFTKEDLEIVGKNMSIQNPLHIIKEITSIAENFTTFAQQASVASKKAQHIAQEFRLTLA